MEEHAGLVNSGPFSDSRKTSTLSKYKAPIFIGLGVFVVLAVVVGLIVGLTLKATPSIEGLANAVTVTNIMGHLTEFNKIAQRPGNKGSRGVLEGYMDSLRYVQDILKKKTGCKLSIEPFHAPVYYELSPPTMSYEVTGSGEGPVTLQLTTDFLGLRYGGNGTHALTNTKVTLIPNGGCVAGDWTGFPTGNVALVFYLTNTSADCTPYEKAVFGEKAGAAAVLIANSINRPKIAASRVRTLGYELGDYLVTVPVLGVSHAVGTMMSTTTAQVTTSLTTNTSIIVALTNNLHCRTSGDAKNVVVIGAHLDGVPAGPGINDNASGSSTLLEIVLQFYRLKFKPHSMIQFSWWGAEEIGLLGSRAFVANSKKPGAPVPFDTIKMAVNFDMLASPNGLPFLHSVRAPNNPVFPTSAMTGSDAITAIFKQGFTSTQPSLYAMAGGSDYYSFIVEGIPSGGLATGAGSFKTAKERTTYGGLAEAAYDPCYHLYCDTVENIGQELLGTTSQAAARAIANFALQKNINEMLAKGSKAT